MEKQGIKILSVDVDHLLKMLNAVLSEEWKKLECKTKLKEEKLWDVQMA